MKKRALLTALLGAVTAFVVRKRKAGKAEQDLWHEAGQAATDPR